MGELVFGMSACPVATAGLQRYVANGATMHPVALAASVAALSQAPAPDYRAELGARLAASVRAVATAEGLDAAVDRAAEIEDQVGPLVAVRYEAALAMNQAGNIQPAIRAYGTVLELAPDHTGALYDRGELWQLTGNPTDRARARHDLEHAESLRPDHWAVPYRLALLAGQDTDARGMSAALTRSLRAGLDLGLLASDPAWRPLLIHPKTGPSILRFARTYGATSLVQQLEHYSRTSP